MQQINNNNVSYIYVSMSVCSIKSIPTVLCILRSECINRKRKQINRQQQLQQPRKAFKERKQLSTLWRFKEQYTYTYLQYIYLYICMYTIRSTLASMVVFVRRHAHRDFMWRSAINSTPAGALPVDWPRSPITSN